MQQFQSRMMLHLRGAAGGVHEADSALAHIGRIQRADEQLIVRLVDRVPALERQHILPLRQRGAHLCGRRAGEDPLWQIQALHLAACVVAGPSQSHV